MESRLYHNFIQDVHVCTITGCVIHHVRFYVSLKYMYIHVHVGFCMCIISHPFFRVAHVLTSSVAAEVQNRPSSKSVSVQTTVGRLTARGHGTAGEGGEGPIILFSKHGDEGVWFNKEYTFSCLKHSVCVHVHVHYNP